MTETPTHWPNGIKTEEEVLADVLAADPEFEAGWERLALARTVAARLIAYRSKNDLSQRDLAKRLGVTSHAWSSWRPARRIRRSRRS